MSRDLVRWKAPDWVPESIKAPNSKAKLANTPTPIESRDQRTVQSTCRLIWVEPFVSGKIRLPRRSLMKSLDLTSLGFEFPIFIKRDDLTGVALTGNKVRKQEFLIADAIRKGCDSIIAWGPATSNHCRTTALCCAKMGLECHILLTSKEKSLIRFG